jgi:hypothetical protein
MSKKSSSEGSGAGVIGFAVLFIIGLLMKIPPEVWIGLGVVVAVIAVMGLIAWAVSAAAKRREAAEQQAVVDRAARAKQEKKARLDTLGKANASLVESALASVQQVTESEAARDGWLGDVDFTADLQGITDCFAKAHALREVANRLTRLQTPSAHDRTLLAEARTTIANLETTAIERVELIGECAREAKLVDASLRAEREEARAAGQRAELHAELSAMLYGAVAIPSSAPTSSAADAVLARVQAYREIKKQIVLPRH